MFKRIATAALMLGTLMAVVPAGAYAQDWRDYRTPVTHREHVREVRTRDRRERERLEHRAFENRWKREHFHRGYYDRYGYWHH